MKKHLITMTMIALSVGLVAISGCGNGYSSPSSYSSTPPAPPSSPNTVAMASMSFSPSTMTVARNTTITWKNDDGVTHTATSDGGQWNTGDIVGGASKSITFTTAGTFTYHCTYHSMMTGTIIVQ